MERKYSFVINYTKTLWHSLTFEVLWLLILNMSWGLETQVSCLIFPFTFYPAPSEADFSSPKQEGTQVRNRNWQISPTGPGAAQDCLHHGRCKSLCFYDRETKWLCMTYICPVKAKYITFFATDNGSEPAYKTVSSLNAECLLIKVGHNIRHAETLELHFSGMAWQWRKREVKGWKDESHLCNLCWK